MADGAKKQFLVIKPSSLGDVLHAFPAAAALHGAYPDAAIDWVVNPAFAELLDYMPFIRRKILFRRKELGNLKTFFAAFLSLWKDIRRERYDAVIDLQGLLRSALTSRLARTKLRCGPERTKEALAGFFYERKLSVPENVRHAAERNCAMIQAFPKVETADPHLMLPVLQKYRDSAERLLTDAGFRSGSADALIAVAPGARWATKQWPPEFFAEVMNKIAERKSRIWFLLLGSAAEQELAEQVKSSLKSGVPTIDLCGKTGLGELTELLRMSELLICNDSGPMHIAAAAGSAVLAFFGSTDPALTGPYCSRKKVMQPEIECVKCFMKQCPQRLCHRSISPEKAAEEALKLMMERSKA